ncbi:uncharacterized protein LOC136086897 [Hydra vulgaris]|uniref:Uncharacterized protein LOC136086897 n=1 Tax=Hydra vulgaris TaxID=6087 RepID=A0ABM4CU64_HYDVU
MNGTNLNSPGEIKININDQDLLTLPYKAYLLFEGQLVKADGTAYANADAVALTNNGMLSYANDFQLAQGLNQLWYKDSTSTAVLADTTGFATRQAYLIQKPTTKRTFSICIPLRHIFGFCDDCDKVIYGLKRTIILVRQSDDNAIFRLAGAAAVKVILNKIQLLMPSLIPSGEEKKRLIDEI